MRYHESLEIIQNKHLRAVVLPFELPTIGVVKWAADLATTFAQKQTLLSLIPPQHSVGSLFSNKHLWQRPYKGDDHHSNKKCDQVLMLGICLGFPVFVL